MCSSVRIFVIKSLFILTKREEEWEVTFGGNLSEILYFEPWIYYEICDIHLNNFFIIKIISSQSRFTEVYHLYLLLCHYTCIFVCKYEQYKHINPPCVLCQIAKYIGTPSNVKLHSVAFSVKLIPHFTSNIDLYVMDQCSSSPICDLKYNMTIFKFPEGTVSN